MAQSIKCLEASGLSEIPQHCVKVKAHAYKPSAGRMLAGGSLEFFGQLFSQLVSAMFRERDL